MNNVVVCLDAANLIVYGKGNPVDALDVLGKYVRAVHPKADFIPLILATLENRFRHTNPTRLIGRH